MLGLDINAIVKQVTEAVDMEPMLSTMDEMLAEVRKTNALLADLCALVAAQNARTRNPR